MRRNFKFYVVFLIIFLLGFSAFAASKQVAAWDSDVLKQPIAVDGRIRRGEANDYSFLLNVPGIPSEPVRIEARLSGSIDGSTGTDASGSTLFDPEKIRFVTDAFTSYIGAKVTSISPGKTTYTDNGSVFEGEGGNIDIIKGATARLTLDYNPEFTHQTGAIWYCVNDRGYSDFSALPGSSDCTILGNETTDVSGIVYDGDGQVLEEDRSLPKIIRAVSIYDPWFSEMEAEHGDEARRLYAEEHPEATDAQVAKMTWREMYLRQDVMTHLRSGEDGIWRYPDLERDGITIYTDYQVTVRSPIEVVTFTARAEYAVGESDYQAPSYLLFNDQLAHPDMTSNNIIWCYDTSDASGGNQEVDAFRVDCELSPDFGYNLEFELVQGSSIGSLDFTELDGNVFRFVPKGTYNDNGTEKKNYGQVVVKVTAEEVNYAKYFTLMYVPSNMKLVKYIGEDMEGWDTGIVIDEATGEVDLDASGEWDVVSYKDSKTGETVTQLYGMECLVLYPGEEFELAIVQYLDDPDDPDVKKPFYMTSGVPTIDYSNPVYDEDGNVGYESRITEYQVTYSVTKTSDPDEEPLAGVLEFEGYGTVSEGFDPALEGVGDVLLPSQTDTGQSYWYSDDAQRIRAVEEGTYYLHYTVAPSEDGQASLGQSTLSGGIYLYIVSPVDQGLTSVIDGQCGNTIMAEIPYRISAGQLKGVHDADDRPMPSHWYLGERGAVGYPAATNGEKTKLIYYGSAYAVFSGTWSASSEDLTNLVHSGSLIGIGSVDMGNEYLEISDKTKPGVPGKAVGEWGGVMAVSMYPYGSDGSPSGGGPGITDVHVTGSYGLSRYPGVRRLRIVDTATKDGEEGLFTKANITYEGSSGVWDFRSLKLECYEHANMGAAGDLIDVFYTPQGLVQMNLNSYDVVGSGTDAVSNRLRASFVWGASSRQTLEVLDVGNNRLPELVLEGFDRLGRVYADGSHGYAGASDEGRRLVVYDCPELEYVQAHETAFNIIMADFPHEGASAMMTVSDDAARMGTSLKADHSVHLRKVNVSGALSYLELIGDTALTSVIGSDTFSASNPDNYTTGTWQGAAEVPDDAGAVRVVNLGSYFFDSGNNEVKGFTYNDSQSEEWQKPYSGLSSKFSKVAGSSSLEVLKLNFVYRLFSESVTSGNTPYDIFDNSGEKYPTSKCPQLKELEVFGLIPDPNTGANEGTASKSAGGESHLSSGNVSGTTTHVYGFDFRHAGNADTRVRFHHVPENASINLSDAKMRSMEILDFQGFLNLYSADNIDDLHINEGNVDKGKSVIEMSRSGVKDFTGVLSLNDVSATTPIIEVLIPANDDSVVDTIVISATPASFNESLKYDMITTSSGHVKIDYDGIRIDANGMRIPFSVNAEGTYSVTVSGNLTDGAVWPEDVTVQINATKEVLDRYEITLNGCDDELSPDGDKVKVLKYETRNDAPLTVDLSAMLIEDNKKQDVTQSVFYDFPYGTTQDDGNPFYFEDGTPMTYEEGYEFAQQNGIPVVVWSFSPKASNGQDYGEVILDSYTGNRVKIKPLVDDQEFTCHISYLSNGDVSINYDTSFIIRVTGGQEDRWSLLIGLVDDPYVIDGIGKETHITATLYDEQILTNGSHTQVLPAEFKENLQWSLSKSGVASIRTDSQGLGGERIYLESVGPGSDTLTVSYLGGKVRAEHGIEVDGAVLSSVSKTPGTFTVIDGGNNYDDIWDIAWDLDISTLTGTHRYESSMFKSGTIRFTTSKGTFDFEMRGGLEGNYVSFDPSTASNFTNNLSGAEDFDFWGVLGTDYTNAVYTDATAVSEHSIQSIWWVMDIDGDGENENIDSIQPYMMAILNSGTAEIISLTFNIDGKDYTWQKTSSRSFSIRTASSLRLSSNHRRDDENELDGDQIIYTQTFTEKSIYDTSPTVNVEGTDIHVNMMNRTLEEAYEYVEEGSPRLLRMNRALNARASTQETVISAKVWKIVAHNCPNFSGLTLQNNGGNSLTTNSLEIFLADNCGSNLSSGGASVLIESNAALKKISMANSNLGSVKVENKNIEEIDMPNNRILSFDTPSSLTKLTHLDCHNNRLGESGGSLTVKGTKVKNSGKKNIEKGAVSKKLLNEIVLYGNGLYWTQQDKDRGGSRVEMTACIGNDIPAGTIISSHRIAYEGHWFGGPSYSGGIRGGATPLSGKNYQGAWSNPNLDKSWCGYKYVKAGVTGEYAGQTKTFYTEQGSGVWANGAELTVYPFGK